MSRYAQVSLLRPGYRKKDAPRVADHGWGMPLCKKLRQIFGELLLLEGQRSTVDAVAHSRGLWTVGKEMAEVGSAGRARHLDALHPVRVVFVSLDRFGRDGKPEARPSAARLELLVRGEQGSVTGSAVVNAGFVIVQ